MKKIYLVVGDRVWVIDFLNFYVYINITLKFAE